MKWDFCQLDSLMWNVLNACISKYFNTSNLVSLPTLECFVVLATLNTGRVHARENPKVVPQLPSFFFWIFWTILLHLPENVVQVQVHEYKASFSCFYFWPTFHIHDFCNFCIAWVCIKDTESRGWRGHADDKEEEKETNHHPLGPDLDWWATTRLRVIIYCVILSHLIGSENSLIW